MLTLFLGNGFDIDLGLQTKYSQFFETAFPKQDACFPSPLRDYLVEMAFRNNWYDIEGGCKEYAIKAVQEASNPQLSTNAHSIKSLDTRNRTYDQIAEDDKAFFKRLCSSLKNYVDARINEDCINHSSYAAYVLKLAVRHSSELQILTFNYTNIRKIQSELHFEKLIPEDNICYIHGSCDDNIILGTDEDLSLTPNYSFLFKSWHKDYKSTPVIDLLNQSTDIVFFGLSFGNIDLVYFEPFFRRICNGEFDKERKTITIFTFDESSRQSIMLNLLKMGIKTMELKNHCNLNFVSTSNLENKSQSDNSNFQRFIEYITKIY